MEIGKKGNIIIARRRCWVFLYNKAVKYIIFYAEVSGDGRVYKETGRHDDRQRDRVIDRET